MRKSSVYGGISSGRGERVRKRAAILLRQSYSWRVAYIPNRGYFPDILNATKLFGEGVEIGVQRGVFSEEILRRWRGKRLYSVDPWREFAADSYIDIANAPQEVHDANFGEAVRRLEAFGERSRIVRETSSEAVVRFADGRLDFVYLDAQHHYQAVKADIKTWFPKIRSGGILAGHDYVDGVFSSGVYGVKTAVDEFVREQRLRLVVSRESSWKSWFVFLP